MTTLRIGTRGSNLALWQTRRVAHLLAAQGLSVVEQVVQTQGDAQQTQPIYSLGITGVFTRSLDMALLAGEIDIAVHSLKDVPTVLAEGLVLGAVLPRGPVWDVLVEKSAGTCADGPRLLASGSLRRQAQWLHRFPQDTFCDLRGNIETRLAKLDTQPWNGALFAQAALDRLGLWDPARMTVLDWMLPAPAQGAVGVVCRADRPDHQAWLRAIDHDETHRAVTVERSLLRHLGAGCSAPVGAYAQVAGQAYRCVAVVLSPDGQQRADGRWTGQDGDPADWGARWAEALLAAGGEPLMTYRPI